MKLNSVKYQFIHQDEFYKEIRNLDPTNVRGIVDNNIWCKLEAIIFRAEIVIRNDIARRR